jgi:hypothetical protein
MSDQPSHQGPGPSRKFITEAKSLESRFLLSTTVPSRDIIVWHANPPRTGGVAVQSGSVLSSFVGQPKMNQVRVTDDSKGDVRMSWNSGQLQVFTGVTTTIIQAQRARTDQLTFHVRGDTVTALAARAGSTFHQPGYSTGSTGIELNPHRPIGSLSAHADGYPLPEVHFVHGGIAVQNGSELTVIVNRRKTNVVQITNAGAGDVQVE